jgi:hypothetical protein
MISQQEILSIICTEAIEYGGLQEVPGHKHGARHSYHSAKRGARDRDENGSRPNGESTGFFYPLRLIREGDGTLVWEDDPLFKLEK